MSRIKPIGQMCLAVLAIVALTVGLAACGGGDSSSSSSSGTESSSGATTATGGSENAGVQKAEQLVEEGVKAPTSTGIPNPVAKKPASGKNILYLDCGVPVCKTIGEGVEDATSMLDWNFKTLPMGSTPEEIANAWTQAVREKPDGVIAAGINAVLFKKQLAELDAAGIPYVGGSVTDPVGNGITAVVNGTPGYVQRGDWMARWVVADTGGDADVLFFTIPEFPSLIPEVEAFEKELKALCPTCSAKVVEVTATDIGSKLPSRVVSEVQRDPDVNYIAMGFGDMASGVPQALRAASLTPKIVSAAPGVQNFEDIAKGDEAASIAEPDFVSAWMMTDAMARQFNKEELPYKNYEVLPLQYIEESNVDPSENPYIGIEDYESEFERLWKIGG
jgi:ribose transport system substrate-binding protein